MRTILLVEDDTEVNGINQKALTKAGYTAIGVETLQAARDTLAKEPIDLVVLDVMMPDGDGLSFCKELRETSTVPILFLTARDQERDIVDGLAFGGDDYITKPYRIEELLARIEATLRRVELDKEAHGTQDFLACGPLEMDMLTRRARLNGEDILLSPNEFTLLLLLVRRAGQYVSKEELYKTAWNQPTNNDARAVWVQLSRLRKKLEPTKELHISGSRGEGYCLEYEKL